VRYWKKVAFNIVARMVLNSYILQGKLQWAWQTEIQVQLNCVHNRELWGGVVGAEGHCWSM
jgi:hypothetical protein